MASGDRRVSGRDDVVLVEVEVFTGRVVEGDDVVIGEVKGEVIGRMGCDVCWDEDAVIAGGIGGTVRVGRFVNVVRFVYD
ncbi:hypothetical protein Tco_1462537 [Tanacetum coccineum]